MAGTTVSSFTITLEIKIKEKNSTEGGQTVMNILKTTIPIKSFMDNICYFVQASLLMAKIISN